MPTFDLEKDTAKVKFILEKSNLEKITAEVVVDLDVSGSTQNIYGQGLMQEAVQRVVPIALNFDDNGDIPVSVFNDEENFATLETPLTKNNYTDYVKKFILKNAAIPKWGGTDYAPVLRQNLMDLGFYQQQLTQVNAVSSGGGFFSRLLGKGSTSSVTTQTSLHLGTQSNTKLPAIIYFFTDGANSGGDRKETRNLLEACNEAKSQVYFNFIGVGDEANFTFLQQIGDDYPNTGFVNIKDLARVASDSDKIYEYLLPDELKQWLGKL